MPTKSKGPKPQTEQPKSQVKIQEEVNAIHSKVKELVWAKYVRMHHTPDQIIGDESKGIMIRSKLKDTCLLVEFEQRF